MSEPKPPPTLVGALLLRAAKQGSLVLVRALLSHPSCDLLARDEEGNTALHIAASSGHYHVVEELAMKYSTPCAGNDERHAPLNFPMQNPDQDLGSSAMLTIYLLSAAFQSILLRALTIHVPCDLLVSYEENNAVSAITTSSGQHNIMERLTGRCSSSRNIAAKGDDHPPYNRILSVECLNNAGSTPLMVASKNGKVSVVSTLLSKHRANSMAHNRQHNSCMHLAALHGHISVIDLLVQEFGCNPHTKGHNGRTPLHYASGGGHVELVDKMISEYKCDKMARDIEGHTPLHMAALHGKRSVVKLLISKHECPVECTDNEGNTALLCASSRGHVSTVIMLHTEFGASVAVRNKMNNRVVHMAASNGHIQLLDLFISKFFCSPHTKGYKNRTPLHCACSSGYLEIVNMLITQYYCNPMTRDSSGLIPLHMAALNGRAEVVRLLVTKYGCPVDYTAHNGYTALLFAASMGHCSVVEVVLSTLGADMEACDNNENNAMNLAALQGHSHLLNTLLCKGGASSVNNNTRFLLHQACSRGHLHMVKMLIRRYNSDPMAKSHEGLTPLHVAAGSGKVEVVKDLVTKYSCPVDCVDSEGNTPLHSACSSGCSDVVELLLSKMLKAKPYSRNNSGSCAVHIAAFRGHSEVFSVLVDGFGQKLETKGYHSRRVLHYAAGGGHLEMVEKLVTKYKCDPMARDNEGLTPSDIAVVAGMKDVVKLFINRYLQSALYNDTISPIPNLTDGNATRHQVLQSTDSTPTIQSLLLQRIENILCNILDKYNGGPTPLHSAAFMGWNWQMRLFATELDYSIDCVGSLGFTPLMVASMRGHAYTVKILASEFGADVEARDKNNNTALHLAAINGRMAVVHVLIGELGCIPDSKGDLNQTPLHFACKRGHMDIINRLIDVHKCDPMARDSNGQTPLHAAAASGKENIARVLVTKHSCPVDCVDSNGFTPLMFASGNGHAGTVILLASELGAYVKARDNNNSTALHHAALKGHLDVVHVLVDELGCIPDSKGYFNQTPLHFACKRSHMDIINRLIDVHKCDPMARDSNGQTPLHAAAASGKENIARVLVTKHSCPVDCVDSNGFTPLMFASGNGHAGTVILLASELGADVKARDNDNNTALHHAALNGHLNVVHVLVEEPGCIPDSKGYLNQTPLHFACKRGHMDIINRLIDVHKCDPMARDSNGQTPLHAAAASGKENIVRVLVTKHSCPVDCVDSNGFTPFTFASGNGHAGTIALLASELGADVKARDNDNNTALHHAALNGHLDVVHVLVDELGCIPDSKGYLNQTPLHFACKRGHMDIINRLIDVHKCDPMARDSNGQTPLHAAATSGKENIVRVLVTKHSCPVDCVDSNGFTPFTFASGNGHAGTIALLASELGADVKARDNDNNTALHHAALNGHLDVVHVLVDELGCIPDSKGYLNQTPLHFACKRGHMDIINRLIDVHKCDPMARDSNGQTPLHAAATSGKENIVHVLITKHSCPVDCVDSNGLTPLMFASGSGHESTVKILSEFGANVEFKDKNNQTALHYAALKGHKNVIRVLISDFGSSPDSKGHGNQTPLHAACIGGHVDIANQLIDVYKCDPMARDSSGQTPLHWAASWGRNDIIRLLITKYICPVDCVDSNGLTPLMFASGNGHEGTIKVLVSEFGADLEARDNENKTALHYAAFQGHMNVISALINEFGSNPDSKGYTLLHAACKGGHMDIVNKLISEYKCDPMARSNNGQTSLHAAAAFGKENIVHVLITKHSCPVDCVDSNGLTPLMFASGNGHAGTVILLASELGADVKARDKNNNTALHHAALNGHLDVVRVLIDVFGCNPSTKGLEDQTPLHAASIGGHLDTVCILINEYKCSTTAGDHNGNTTLHIAAGHGREEIVRALITKYSSPVDCVNMAGCTPLMLASAKGFENTVKVLASEFRANVEARNKCNLTSLHFAILNHHKDVVKVLIDKFGCSPESEGPVGLTPLQVACFDGQLDVISMLINEYKCSVNAPNKNGSTPLHTAAFCGRKETVRLLITKYSSPVNIARGDGCTPLMLASLSGHASTVEMLVSELGADVNVRSSTNQSSLHYAATHGPKYARRIKIEVNPMKKESGELIPFHNAHCNDKLEVINLLIDKYKCDVMARDDNGDTPLHIAAACGMEDIVRVLVTKYSCPVDCVNSDRFTPLMTASREGHASTVEVLASEFGADVEAKDKTNQTALHHAAFNGHENVVIMLIEKFSCSPHRRGGAHSTPFHAACRGGHVDLVNKLIEKYDCDPMARNNFGHNSLHIAVLCCKEDVVKELVVNHGCSVGSISSYGNTAIHLASYVGQMSVIKLLLDVFGIFPSVRNDHGNTPIDYNPIEALKIPQLSVCSDYINQRGSQQMRHMPHKVLLLGENSQKMADLINANSTYFLPQSHLKGNACFLNYVNEDLQDMWMCQYSGRSAYGSFLAQTLMSGYSYTAICIVDLDRPTDQVVEELHFQVALIKEVNANSRELETDIIICGISSVKESAHEIITVIHQQAKKMITGSTRIVIIETLPMCLHKEPPEVGLKETTTLMKILKHNSNKKYPKMRHGSMYLFKLLLRGFNDVPYVTYTQLNKHLQDKRILSENTHEDIWIFLKELDSHHFIVIVGDRSDPQTMIIITNPLVILDNLNRECKESSDPLIKTGIVTQTFLSTSLLIPVHTFAILTLLRKFGLPSIEYPLQKLTSDVSLKKTLDTYFFIPHIIADTRKSRKWLLPLDNPFTIGLSLEVVDSSDLFSLEFQYSLLTRTTQHIIRLLERSGEMERRIQNATWQGGTLWALHDIEILAEVLESGRSVAVLARSCSHCDFKCINLVYQIKNIMLNLIHQYCSHVMYKTYIVNSDSLRTDIIPLANGMPSVEVSSVVSAIDSDQTYVQDTEGTRIPTQQLSWLWRFTLRGQIFAVDHLEVYHILKPVSGQWRDIGRELGVSERILQTLQDAKYPPDQCCSKMIEKWLMYSGNEPSWYSLTEALRNLKLEESVDKTVTKWGTHVKSNAVLKDEKNRNQKITDVFLSAFAEVIKPHWNLLAPYIVSTNSEKNELQQLQAWKEEKSPTYGDLDECLNQLVINPVIAQEHKQDEKASCRSGEASGEEDGVESTDSWDVKDLKTLEERKQKQLLDEALEEGHIKTGLDILLFVGAAGSGKSHYKHLCLGLPPPEVRDSTGLSEHPVRIMSLVRGAVEQIPQKRETTDCTHLQWHEVPAKQYLELIVEAILEGRLEKKSDPAMMTKLVNRAIEGLPMLDMEYGLATTECMTSAQKESTIHDEPDTPKLDQVVSQKKIPTQGEWHSSVCVRYESNFYHDLLKKLKSSITSRAKLGKLLDVDWVYIVDSGGQPQFREMLPVLVQMATACVLTLKLNEPLGELNEVKIFCKGQELCRPYLSVLTNEQIVNHCSQIVGSQTKDCKLFVVGTHQDLEHECQTETRADKNEKLLKLLKPQLGINLEMHKTGVPGELVFPVNSKTPKRRDYKVVEQFRRAVCNVARSKEKVNIPLYWFLLELLLHELATKSGILSFEGCKEQAIHQLKFSEEAFSTAVKFLAQRLGTILYFPKVLPNIIFTPQALMNVLSEIVKLRHLLSDSQPLPAECQGHSGEWLEFQRFGTMTKILLETAPLNDFFSNIFTPNDFLIVSMKLLIAAKICEDVFFFPSVLEELSPVGVQKIATRSHDCLAPLVLYCTDSAARGHSIENWLPVGSFTSLVAHLLNVNRWTLCKDEMQNPTCLYRNCIQFTLPDNQPGIVTLVDKFRYMEVHIQVNPKMAKRISKTVCPHIHYGLKRVHECLNYSKSNVEIAFLCPQPEHDESHLATLSWSDMGQWMWTCKKDRRISEELTEKQKPWLQDYLGDPKVSVLMSEVAAELPAKWEQFAVQIELDYECIQDIKRKHPRDNYGCFMAVFQQWNMQRTVPFTWEKVVAVLQNKPLEERRVAQDIAKKFVTAESSK